MAMIISVRDSIYFDWAPRKKPPWIPVASPFEKGVGCFGAKGGSFKPGECPCVFAGCNMICA